MRPDRFVLIHRQVSRAHLCTPHTQQTVLAGTLQIYLTEVHVLNLSSEISGPRTETGPTMAC